MERIDRENLSRKQIEKAKKDLVMLHALTLRDGWLPDIRLLMEEFGLNTTSAVVPRLEKIQSLGWIVREEDASRKIMVTDEGRKIIGEEILKLINKSS